MSNNRVASIVARIAQLRENSSAAKIQRLYCTHVLANGIALLHRVVLGGLFVYAGATKITDPGRFLVAIRSYEIVGDPWAAWIAVWLPWVEVFAGICVIMRSLYRGALALLTAAMAIFLVAISSAWARGLDVECGCFAGKGLTGSYLEIILRDLLILGVAIYLMLRQATLQPSSAANPDS